MNIIYVRVVDILSAFAYHSRTQRLALDRFSAT